MYRRSPGIVGALLLAFLTTLALAPSAIAQSANGVMARYVDDNAPPNWDLHASSASCAALDGDMPYRTTGGGSTTGGRRSVGRRGRGEAACGLCLLLTNVGTGATMTVRIVDDCGKTNHGAVLAIDAAGLWQIYSDGRGRIAGQLEVNYQFVACQDN